MIKTFTEEVHCTPTEIADEIWEMSGKEQIIVLRALNTRFFKDEGKGLMQMAFLIITTKTGRLIFQNLALEFLQVYMLFILMKKVKKQQSLAFMMI